MKNVMFPTKLRHCFKKVQFWTKIKSKILDEKPYKWIEIFNKKLLNI